MRKPIAKKKPTNVMMPPEYPTEPGSKPRMMQKGKPINNPQATPISTALDSAVGGLIAGAQGHRTAAQEAKRSAMRKKDTGGALVADVKDVAKTTTDFYRTSSPPPVMGTKGVAAAAKMKKKKKRGS